MIAVIFLFGLGTSTFYAQTNTQPAEVVGKCLKPLVKEMESLKNTVSENIVWI